jgi:hypothetical protein
MTSKDTDWFYYTRKRWARQRKEIEEGMKEVKKALEDFEKRNKKKRRNK